MALPKLKLDPSTLVSYSHAAAGHDGVRSDPTGAVLIKPCTQAEVEFYTSTTSGHPAFREFMPTFMGTLTARGPDDGESTDSVTVTATVPAEKPTSNSKAGEGDGHVKDVEKEEKEAATWASPQGRELDTDLSIVLENATAGFKRPSVIDLKLGARLWDDYAPETKRKRLDEVSNATTSGSLGFRVAGMKVFRPARKSKEPAQLAEHIEADDDGYLSYNKLYGRGLQAGDVRVAFFEFFGGKEAFAQSNATKQVAKRLAAQILQLAAVLEKEESRIYSSSILAVYEGDEETLTAALEQEKNEEKTGEVGSRDQGLTDEDEDEDEKKPKVCDMRMIDFAHAQWTPGQGPDINVLRGIKNVQKIFEQLATTS